MKLSKNQRDVILLMREGQLLYENKVTSAARWTLTKYKGSYKWGNVHGSVINKIKGLLEETRKDMAASEYTLTELGKTIIL